MLETKTLGPKFEYRHYEALRCEALAPVIGAAAITGTQAEQLTRLKKRRKTEVQSSLAESLKPEKVRSVIDTHYSIEMNDGQLVAEDSEPIEDMLQRALKADQKLADQDEFFAFLPQQTQYDIDELHEWEAMGQGETDYNTLLTFLPYREEYDDGSIQTQAKLLRAAQKPYWRRGMFRVAHAHGGKVNVFNYSFDNCSVELIAEAAKEEMGYEFEAQTSLDMQGERVQLQVDDDSWRFIAPRLVSQGDKILARRHGGVWKHGHNPQHEVRRAQAYVESQHHAVDSLLAIDKSLALKHSHYEAYEEEFMLKFYDCIALLEKRLELGQEDEPILDYSAAAGGAGNTARAEGKVYDACGTVFGHGQHASQQAGTGDKTGFESLKRLEGKRISCYACKKNVVVPKQDLDKGMLSCGECGYWLDVCTGKNGFRKGFEQITGESMSGFDIISNWFRKEKQETEIKKTAERQARADLGDNVTELDKKRYEKQVRQRLAA